MNNSKSYADYLHRKLNFSLKDDKLCLKFLDIQKEQNKVIHRKISMKGEEIVEQKLNN